MCRYIEKGEECPAGAFCCYAHGDDISFIIFIFISYLINIRLKNSS